VGGNNTGYGNWTYWKTIKCGPHLGTYTNIGVSLVFG
jgi:hypothetical protein